MASYVSVQKVEKSQQGAYDRFLVLRYAWQLKIAQYSHTSGTDSAFAKAHTLLVRLYRAGNFFQKILGYYSETTKDSETNDTSFESPIIEPLE